MEKHCAHAHQILPLIWWGSSLLTWRVSPFSVSCTLKAIKDCCSGLKAMCILRSASACGVLGFFRPGSKASHHFCLQTEQTIVTQACLETPIIEINLHSHSWWEMEVITLSLPALLLRGDGQIKNALFEVPTILVQGAHDKVVLLGCPISLSDSLEGHLLWIGRHCCFLRSSRNYSKLQVLAY